ncbi:ras-related protein Rab-15 [Biomphalaria glabrata]|uniref:Ras-related protein Rab-15-like n=1 Tax=Biomphalaria glabrata TaxID=6526 RepID=A0A2C9K599_BIOGL|nr:ras-related protein Rab-15-like [Biomphalaria glabrata]XP_055878520.1 ras-related protein Rab-15-like [Biomphalaria glabrata]XP_055878522.1 ras-related protein Rab-15-like [Biomphalaria glabrata]KAI8741230.1 ras-related protein Rab-15-like [Biomphalaria glabrata]KAI8787858.1 ras-related protein Rab-15 [Biomphalaria glabrata]
MAKRYDTLVRLLLVGDTGVGKTCLICQYACNEFHETHITTVGVDFKMKTISMDGKNVRLQIWDTAGQERFEAITKQFYTRAQGCVLVYDICSRSSFESLTKWLLFVQQYAKDGVVSIIVGNKSDLSSKRQVPKQMAQQFANDNNLRFYEVSAKDSNSLIQPFDDICKDILIAENKRLQEVENVEKIDLKSPDTRNKAKSNGSPGKKCC